MRHWRTYRSQAISDVPLLGYAGAAVLAVCLLTGLILTGQALFGVKTWAWLRYLHLISTLLGGAITVPHLMLAFWRRRNQETYRTTMKWVLTGAGSAVAATVIVMLCTAGYSGIKYRNVFPADYSFAYGANRPSRQVLPTQRPTEPSIRARLRVQKPAVRRAPPHVLGIGIPRRIRSAMEWRFQSRLGRWTAGRVSSPTPLKSGRCDKSRRGCLLPAGTLNWAQSAIGSNSP